MARAYYRETAQLTDANGFVKKVENPEVTVYQPGTTTPLVDTLYAADTGDDTELSNPFTGAADGSVEFYLETPQRVSVKFDGASVGLGTATKLMDPGNLNTGLYSSSGEHVATISDDGVFSVPGLLSKLGGWDLEMDGGLVPGQGMANATANAAKFHALRDRVAALGGGDLLAKQEFALDPIDLHHGLGSDVPINIIGAPARGQFRFAGTAGPFLSVGETSSDGMLRAGITDLILVHGGSGSSGVVASGATLLIGAYARGFLLENVNVLNRGAGEAALTAVEVRGAPTPRIRGCKFETRNDTAALETAGLFPTGILFSKGGVIATDGPIGGAEVYETGIDGCAGRSYGVRFNHPTGESIDTPRFSKVLIKDHWRAVAHSSAGQVYNWISSDLVLDGVSGSNALHLEPTTGGVFANAQFTATWTAAVGGAAFYLSGGNGGTVRDNQFRGGLCANGTTTQVVVTAHATVLNNDFDGLKIMSQVNTPGEFAVDVGGASGASVANSMRGCVVQALGSASGAARFSSNCTGTRVQGNTWVGVTASIGFANGAGNNKDGNIFVSSL